MDSNKADWGGAISLWRGRVTVTSSLIVNNYADWGAAMTVVHPSAAATLNRCTISGNAGLSYGGAISLAESSYVSLRNSILRNEGIGEIRSSFISGWGSGTVEVGHCNVESLHSTFDAGDNIDADPLFMNAGAGDYRLQAGSPCIDTGDPSSGMDPDGSRVDMGAIPFGSAHPLTVSDLPQPTGLILAQNAPNPFNPSTTIRYTVPVDDIAYMAIYDVSGRHVRTLVDRRVAAGEHSVVWDGHDDTGRQAASGVYLYRLKTRDFVQARRLTLIR